MNDEKNVVLGFLRRMFEEAVGSSLSESAGEAILFVLRSKFRRDPFEVFWESPKTVYEELEKIFGEGTRVLITLLVRGVRKGGGMNVDSEKISSLMRSDDPKSVEELHTLLKELAEFHAGKGFRKVK